VFPKLYTSHGILLYHIETRFLCHNKKTIQMNLLKRELPVNNIKNSVPVSHRTQYVCIWLEMPSVNIV
jgi:hypothetical protein